MPGILKVFRKKRNAASLTYPITYPGIMTNMVFSFNGNFNDEATSRSPSYNNLYLTGDIAPGSSGPGSTWVGGGSNPTTAKSYNYARYSHSAYAIGTRIFTIHSIFRLAVGAQLVLFNSRTYETTGSNYDNGICIWITRNATTINVYASSSYVMLMIASFTIAEAQQWFLLKFGYSPSNGNYFCSINDKPNSYYTANSVGGTVAATANFNKSSTAIEIGGSGYIALGASTDGGRIQMLRLFIS